ncbi:phage tail spike protein [Neobacillus sp. 3P2-tot-E-2]|uniref:phage tail spike protein n=1 Tax=Neobacillus sp. 3P2-tot-E-2 TaxID=3132212 RepID=UPI0039A32717
MIYIFDKNEQLLTILKPDGPCPYKEAAHIEQLNKENTFSFWIPADHADSQYVKEENLVAFKDLDGDIRLFVIKELDEVHDDVLYKEAFCQAAWKDELGEEPLQDIRPQNKTAAEALTSALQNTRWKVGNVASLGTNSTNFYYEKVTSAITKILTIWGGEVKDRITVSNGKITGRYIDILARRGADTGKRFEITKDIQSLKRTILSYPKTALYGRGKGLETEAGGYSRKITFADIVWSTANGNPADKPAGQEWVGDPVALSQFGRENPDGSKRHRFDFVDFSDEEDPANLLNQTWNDLQNRTKPIMRYEMKVIDLEKIPGFEHEKSRLGDTVFSIDRFFSPALLIEARIIEIKRYLNEPERTEIKLGNFIDDIFDYNKKLEQIETKINDNSGIWEQGGGPVTDTDFPDTVPPVPTNFKASGAFKTVMLSWDFNPSSYIASYEIYASKVNNFTADISNRVWSGKAGGYVHQGNINETWYFRIRAVNTHGTQSALSAQISAATVQIKAEDILPYVITNELIAENAAIDFAKIANVEIINAMISNLSMDKLEGGYIKLGELYGDGQIHVYDSTGNITGRIDPSGIYSPTIRSNNFIGNVVNKWLGAGNVTYYVDCDNGNDANDGLTSLTPKRNIQALINSYPKDLNAANISIRAKGSFGGIIFVTGFRNGYFRIIEWDESNSLNTNQIWVDFCDYVMLQNVTTWGTSATGDAMIYGYHCKQVEIVGCKAYGESVKPFAFLMEGTTFFLNSCHVYEVTDRGLYANKNSHGVLLNGKGSAPVAVLAENGSVVSGYGSRWDGSLTAVNAGEVWPASSWIIDTGTSTPPPSTPPAPVQSEQTLSVTPSTGDNYSTNGYWTDNEVKQGNWGHGDRYGLWYMDLSAIKGKTIVSATITVNRIAGSGNNAARTIHFRTHRTTKGNRGTGAPAMSAVAATGSIAISETLTFDITSMVQNNIANGADTAIGVHTTGQTDYMSLGTQPTITIRYK